MRPSATRVNGATCVRLSMSEAEPELPAGLAAHALAALLRCVELVRVSNHQLEQRCDALALSSQQAAESLHVLAWAAARRVGEHDAELRGRHVPALVQHAHARDRAHRT